MTVSRRRPEVILCSRRYDPERAGRNSKSVFRQFDLRHKQKQLVVCIDNDGYAASLERRKIYVALRNTAAEKHGLLRIVEESGEDYLYPRAFFRSIALPQAVRRDVLAAA